jgi:hypothetical protein
MKPITKQLAIAALILSSVTVVSFGIRRIRFILYRADITEPAPSVSLSEIEDQHQAEQPIYAEAESEYYWEDSDMAYTEPDPQDTEESFWEKQELTEEYVEAKTDLGKKDKASKKDKSFKGDYAKVKDSKGFKKISLSKHENLFLSKEGETWYVSEGPGGEVTKMQVQVDGYTGELITVGGGYYSKQEPQRIPIGAQEDIYLTDEGQVWYVSEQPDGETVKVQVEVD